jgi:hypothetical protein
MKRRRFVAVFQDRLLELGLSGLVLGLALVAVGVRILDPWAVELVPLAALIIGFLLANIGGGVVGLQFAGRQTGQRLVLGGLGAVVSTIVVGSYLSTATDFILGPPVVVGGLSVAVVIGFVVALVERGR